MYYICVYFYIVYSYTQCESVLWDLAPNWELSGTSVHPEKYILEPLPTFINYRKCLHSRFTLTFTFVVLPSLGCAGFQLFKYVIPRLQDSDPLSSQTRSVCSKCLPIGPGNTLFVYLCTHCSHSNSLSARGSSNWFQRKKSASHKVHIQCLAYSNS